MNSDFYVIGGTLGHDTPSYVPRDADEQLFKAFADGDYCYLLTSRQMGKSSLMVRAASRLREQSTRVAVIDLTAIGVNVTAEQWYDGLISRLGQQLDAEEPLEQVWHDARDLGPLQRWLLAIDKVLLRETDGELVIFIDEIDVVRSLPFACDEFFAAIRHCFNRRREDPRWQRLTFCLLGVATPSDLIDDPHMTPFNIGRRIELNDFRIDEAAVLATGLDADEETARHLLARVMYWTDGHPYLTQRLCWEVAKAHARNDRAVDRVCEQVFFTPAAREQDDNLAFVRQRLLRATHDRAALLECYQRILRYPAESAEHNSLTEILDLAGVVRTQDGRTEVRNRIYRRVFDRHWIRRNMPDSERRRQRAAYVRGVIRATAVAAVMILLLIGAFGFAFVQWRSAEQTLGLLASSEQAERAARGKAEQAQTEAEHAKLLVEQALAREKSQRERAESREREANRLRVEEAKQRALAESGEREANRLRMEEAKQRALAESREREANELRMEEAKQRTLAEAREREAIELRQQERSLRQLAERKEAEAVDSFRRMRIAFEQLTDERRSSAERARLFARIPDWLQAYSAEAVSQFALEQVNRQEMDQALKTYAEFCELALGDDEGFWARQLVQLEPHELSRFDLDTSLLDVRIKVPPEDIYAKALVPGIELGESRASGEATQEVRHLLASLYGSRGRLVFEYRHPSWDEGDPLGLVVRSYGRAIELNPGRYDYYLGRAVAQYWRKDAKQYGTIRDDLQSALARYPTKVEPVVDGQPPGEDQRDVARIRHGLGCVQELIADDNGEPTQSLILMASAAEHYIAAHQLQPAEVRYVVALARVYRKHSEFVADSDEANRLLQRSSEAIQTAKQIDDRYPQLFNEQGEIQLLAGDVAAARQSFDNAVRLGSASDAAENLYRYLCNQSNAYCRAPAAVANLNRAFDAAGQAIKLNVTGKAEAHYYLGLSLWGMARAETDTDRRRDKILQALKSFDTSLAENSKHVGALAARCQIIFEATELTFPPKKLAETHADAQRAKQLARTRAEKAKVHYVFGLGRLRFHIDSGEEAALIECLEAMLAATKHSLDYRPLAAAYFQRTAKRQWSDAKNKERFADLTSQFAATKQPEP